MTSSYESFVHDVLTEFWKNFELYLLYSFISFITTQYQDTQCNVLNAQDIKDSVRGPSNNTQQFWADFRLLSRMCHFVTFLCNTMENPLPPHCVF